MIFDLTYWLVLGLGALLSGWAALHVRRTFERYRRFPTWRGASGAAVAARILRDHGIHDVAIRLFTLPVEFDASRRALATLTAARYLNADELRGARRVLDAAAMTYVAAFATSLMQLLYWVYSLGLIGGGHGEESA